MDEIEILLEHILEADPRTMSNPDCEYGWIFHQVNKALKKLKELERKQPMEAYTFLKAVNDICEENSTCEGCPLENFKGCGAVITDISEEEFRKAVGVIKTWLDKG